MTAEPTPLLVAEAAESLGTRDATDLRRRTLTGMSWTAMVGLWGQFSSFGVAIVLSRLLIPRDFGLVGMVAVFSGFLTVISNFGFSQALVQRMSLHRSHLVTAFWITTAAQVALGLVFILGAPLVADFYGVPKLRDVSMTMGVTLALALSAVPGAMLERAMEYKKLARIEFTAGLVKNGSAIAMAIAGFGVWSLILSPLISTGYATIVTFMVVRWFPIGRPSMRALRDLWTVGAGTVGSQAVGYWSSIADNLLVGKFLGAKALGLYSRAYTLMLAPLAFGTQAVARVMISALSAIQDDHERLKRAYMRGVGLIALLVFPAAAGLALCAGDFVHAVLGPNWSGTIGPLRILATVTLLQAVTSTTWWIYQSTGRTDIQFRWGLVAGVLTIGGFAVTVHYGVTAVAAGYAGTCYLLAYWTLHIPGRIIGLRVSEILRALTGVFAATAAMAVVVAGVSLGMQGTSAGPRLAAKVVAGAVTYVVVILLVRPTPYRDLLTLLPSRLRRHRPAHAAS